MPYTHVDTYYIIFYLIFVNVFVGPRKANRRNRKYKLLILFGCTSVYSSKSIDENILRSLLLICLSPFFQNFFMLHSKCTKSECLHTSMFLQIDLFDIGNRKNVVNVMFNEFVVLSLMFFS